MNEIIRKQKDNQIIMKESDFITLCESLNNSNKGKTEFEKHIGVNTKTNCSLEIYEQIWQLKDEGFKPRQIIGRTLKKKSGKLVHITKRIYYLAMERRKEV